MRSGAIILLLLISAVLLCAGCASNVDEQSHTGARTYTDFEGKTVGLITGTVCGVVIEEDINGIPAYYSDISAGVEDVRSGRISGFMADLSVLRVIAGTSGGEGLKVIPVPKEIFAGPLGAFSMDQAIIDRFNIFLEKLNSDGTLRDIQERWLINVPDLESSMPDFSLTGENGHITVATSGTQLPFSYFGANNELKGYSIELVKRFAEFEGKSIEFETMDFPGLIPFVASGRADLGIDGVTITEERKEVILFSESIYDDLLAIIALEALSDSRGAANESEGFIERLRTGIERNLITDSRWMLIVDGLGVTMLIAVVSQITGTILGCFICYILTRKSRPAKLIASLYCGLIRGTPVVVLLMITYYIIFGNSNISNILVAIAAFTMVTGASVGQTLKGAIDTVDEVEIEAARSIGFSAFRAFLTVTLPQAVRRAMPGYTGGFVELVKVTAIVGFIAIQDLTRAANIIQSRTFDVYFPLLLIAAIYLIITTICIQLFKLAINKINGGERK